MRKRLCRWIVPAFAIAIACSGCSDYASGTPTPTSSTTPPGTSSPPAPDTYGAPRVTTPLDASAFLGDPCSILTASQLASVDLPAKGQPDTDSAIAKTTGPGCTWQNDTKALGTKVTFITGNKNGLSDLYRGHQQGDFKFWEPTTVADYPAVLSDPTDMRSMGACGLDVGISDTLTFLAGEADPRIGPKACDRSRRVATMVIETLKAGN